MKHYIAYARKVIWGVADSPTTAIKDGKKWIKEFRCRGDKPITLQTIECSKTFQDKVWTVGGYGIKWKIRHGKAVLR